MTCTYVANLPEHLQKQVLGSPDYLPAGSRQFELIGNVLDIALLAEVVKLAKAVSPMLLSFMSESRRLSNRRMKLELGVRVRYATVVAALAG